MSYFYNPRFFLDGWTLLKIWKSDIGFNNINYMGMKFSIAVKSNTQMFVTGNIVIHKSDLLISVI